MCRTESSKLSQFYKEKCLKTFDNLLPDGWLDFEMNELASHRDILLLVLDLVHDTAIALAQLAQAFENILGQIGLDRVFDLHPLVHSLLLSLGETETFELFV